MGEFNNFRKNLDARLEYERQSELGINPEQLQLASRLDSFFSGLHEELVSKNVPLHEIREIQEAHTVRNLKKKIFRIPLYENVLIPRNEHVITHDYWILYYLQSEYDRTYYYYQEGRSLRMMQDGKLRLAKGAYETDDKYHVYKGLSDMVEIQKYDPRFSVADYKYDGILRLLEPNIRELLNIK